MYSISWFYLYGVGGLMYAGGSYLVWRAGVLDFSAPQDRRIYWFTTGCLVLFAVVHALFQFVFPFID